MKKYITEIVLICFFLIANVGIYLYFDNEINSVKAGQLVAKMEAEEKADKVKEPAEKAQAGVDETKEQTEKTQAGVDGTKEQTEKTQTNADEEKKRKEKKKKKKEKERNERLGIHKYRVEKSKYINWESANDKAIRYAEKKGFSKSYLLHIDSREEWDIVEKN